VIKTIFVSHDGVLEDLGQSQILSYQLVLGSKVKIVLFSFEKQSDLNNKKKYNKIKNIIKKNKIEWHPLVYRSFPPKMAQIISMVQLAGLLFLYIRIHQAQILHARSYPCMMACLLADPFGKVKKIFDMRGFWPDEKVNAGLWGMNSLSYRMAKKAEKVYLQRCDQIVCLTKVARRILGKQGIPQKKISYIPTCVNLHKFVPPSSPPSSRKPVFCFNGNMTGWYNRHEMIESARILLQEFGQSHLMVLTKESQETLRRDMIEKQIPCQRYTLRHVEFDKMPGFLASANMGIFLVRPAFSEKGRSPTKFGEFLACGIPVITNEGVGDCAEIIRREKVGLVLARPTAECLVEQLPRIRGLLEDPSVSRRCRLTAEKYFALQRGVNKYYSIYQRLANSD